MRRSMTKPVRYAGALLVGGGRILLGLRSFLKSVSPGCWDLFGGQVEPGESFEEALRRELAEELGIEAAPAGELARIALPMGGEYRIFMVTRWTGEPRLADEEHSAMGWFAPDEACELKPLAAPGYRLLFRSLRGRLGG